MPCSSWPGSSLRRTHILCRRWAEHSPASRKGRIVPLISTTCAAIGGPDEPGHDGWATSTSALISLAIVEMCVRLRDKPGHDDVGTFPAIVQMSDFAVVSKMCELGRAKPGHDGEATGDVAGMIVPPNLSPGLRYPVHTRRIQHPCNREPPLRRSSGGHVATVPVTPPLPPAIIRVA